MDAVDRNLKMVGLEKKMAYDRKRWRKTIDDLAANPDDGTIRRKGEE